MVKYDIFLHMGCECSYAFRVKYFKSFLDFSIISANNSNGSCIFFNWLSLEQTKIIKIIGTHYCCYSQTVLVMGWHIF